jgi:hypothetical protein
MKLNHYLLPYDFNQAVTNVPNAMVCDPNDGRTDDLHIPKLFTTMLYKYFDHINECWENNQK